MSDLILYHNPRCSKSRSALEWLQGQGLEPTVVRYLDTPLDKAALSDLLRRLGLGARELLRTGEEAYKALKLADPSLSEEALIDAMVREPRLIERPILVRGERAAIGRPLENLKELLS
ncbi:arsenate reductase (glutaredoxin) [Pseudomonas sp. DC3000-4b1]|uniref:arsenate reductase (glutaredoxin) n=1 Tax=unclassified Pseudomonas TaxID=196821 RepID=UPI003CE93C1F